MLVKLERLQLTGLTQALGANETFVHNDKIVLEATDMLGFITASSADVDVVVSYLDQTL